jgi:hypothetical protein
MSTFRFDIAANDAPPAPSGAFGCYPLIPPLLHSDTFFPSNDKKTLLGKNRDSPQIRRSFAAIVYWSMVMWTWLLEKSMLCDIYSLPSFTIYYVG